MAISHLGRDLYGRRRERSSWIFVPRNRDPSVHDTGYTVVDQPRCLRHRLIVDSVCHWFLYTLPFFTFQAYPHRPRLYAWDRGRKTKYRWLSATFPTQRRRLVLDRTDNSKIVLSLLHSGRSSLTLAESSRDIW